MTRVADDLLLIAQDEQSGRLVVAERVIGLGLAAGLLGELVMSGHLAVVGGAVFPVARPAPVDRLLREVLAVVAGARADRDVGVWLRFLAVEAVTDVRYRLVSEGVLAEVAGRRLGVLRETRFLPVDRNVVVWPEVRLAGVLSRTEPVTIADALLTCLAQATGVLGRVLWFPAEHAPGWAYAQQLRASLPAPLGELVAQTEAAVGEGMLTRRGV